MCDAVFLDGQQLKMRALETRQQHVLDGLDGDRDLSLSWDLQFPELGNTIEIVTAYMRVVVWLQYEGLLEDVRLPKTCNTCCCIMRMYIGKKTVEQQGHLVLLQPA